MEVKPNVRECALQYGLSFPNDEELIMLILGKGTKKAGVRALAQKVIAVINRCNSEQYVEKLLRIDGIGLTRALAIAAALELGRRRMGFLGVKIRHPFDLIPFVKHITIEMQEHFLCASLNGANELLQIRVVATGALNSTLVSPREVFSDAIADRAASLIFCHNHPSGNVNPSLSDIETTEKLLAAAKILGITVLDHIIIATDTYFSFMEHGILFEKREALAKKHKV